MILRMSWATAEPSRIRRVRRITYPFSLVMFSMFFYGERRSYFVLVHPNDVEVPWTCPAAGGLIASPPHNVNLFNDLKTAFGPCVNMF